MANIVHFVTLIGFFVHCSVDFATGTECYVCYSWKHSGCEEDYMENVNLTTCGTPPITPTSSLSSHWQRDREREERERLLNAPPTTCVKDVIHFIQPSVRNQHDPYNRFNRPWIERKCGVPIQAAYRSGRDLVDGCEEVEVTIEGVRGIKRSCTCSSDGCNSGVSLNINDFIRRLLAVYIMVQFTVILS